MTQLFFKKLKYSYKKTYTLPFDQKVPNDIKDYLLSSNILKIWFKFLKRYLFLVLNKQANLERSVIVKKHKKILWINLSAPSLGDSLMDLSSRILLKQRDLDLFTDNFNAVLYKNDQYFENVYTKITEVCERKYDLIIIDSFSTRTVKIKCRIAFNTEFVSMFGFFNGPDINRTLYSFYRMNSLLGQQVSQRDISKLYRPSITLSPEDIDLPIDISLPKKYIVIAVGGEWEYRTYNHWIKVIKLILNDSPRQNVILVGSKNALDYLEKNSAHIDRTNIQNLVNKISFLQTASIIKSASLVLCCDGGLMHAACAVDARMIVLISRIKKEMRLTKLVRAEVLFDNADVNNIKPERVYKKYKELQTLL